MRIEGYEYQTDFLRQAFAEGKQEGKQEGLAEGARRVLLAILDARGLAVSPHHRDRIDACGDDEQLEVWARRALAVQSVDALFV